MDVWARGALVVAYHLAHQIYLRSDHLDFAVRMGCYMSRVQVYFLVPRDYFVGLFLPNLAVQIAVAAAVQTAVVAAGLLEGCSKVLRSADSWPMYALVTMVVRNSCISF